MKSIEELCNKFKSLNTEFKTLSENMPTYIGVNAVRYIKKNFKEKSFDGGAKWDKLSETTEEFYDSKKFGTAGTVYNKDPKNLLEQSGKLRDSIHYEFDKGKIWIGINSTVTLPYAKIHNEGGSFLMFGKIPKIMPQRKYLGWSAGLRDNIRKNALSKFNVLMRKYL